MARVIVIGAGIAGLATAALLLREGARVTIAARDTGRLEAAAG